MSDAFGAISLARAQQEAARFLGLPENAWRAASDRFFHASQRVWLERMLPVLPALSGFQDIKAFASTSAAEINQRLVDAGFADIQLDPWSEPDAFGVASVFRWAVRWLVIGQTEVDGRPLRVDGLAAFRLGKAAGVTFRKLDGELVVDVPTQSGETAHLVRYTPILFGVEILERIREVELTSTPERFAADGVDIPKVQLDVQPDLEWILGMLLGEYFIAQAKQQVRMVINEIGAAGEEVSALGMKRGMPEFYAIKPPFLFWVTKPDVAVPIAMAQVTRDSCREPIGKLADGLRLETRLAGER